MSRLTDDELLDELKKRFLENKRSLEELKELTTQLRLVNKKLEESEAMKSHFISNITNEIINPFTSIVGLAKNIMSIDNGSTKQIKQMAGLIFHEAFTLDFQLKNIFVAAEIEAGEMYPQISLVDIQALAQSVLETFDYQISYNKLEIKFSITNNSENDQRFVFKTDAEKFKLIVTNILSNAIKFSQQGGLVDFKIIIEPKHIELIIKDFGIGISRENQQIIFDRFKRLDSGIHSLNRGHGLGLSICKAILDMLDGEIKIESEPNKGSTFHLTIPEPEFESDIEDFSTDGNEIFFGDNELF